MDRGQWQRHINVAQGASGAPCARPLPLTKSLLVDLSDHDLLYIHGLDAKAFLQGQLTCQMDDLAQHISHLSTHCDPKGRVLSLMRIHAWQDGFLLSLPPAMAPICQKALKTYVMRSKVQMDVVNDDIGQIAVIGNDHPLSNIYPKLPSQADEIIAHSPQHAITIMRHPTPTYLIQAPYAQLFEVWQACSSDCDIASSADWQHQQYLGRIATAYPATSGLFTPHMLNLPNHDAVCLQKGCFCGQEIIARTHYRGQNKRILSRWHGPIDIAVQASDALYGSDGAKVGTIVDAIQVADSHTACLAVVHERGLNQTLSFDAQQQIACTPDTGPTP